VVNPESGESVELVHLAPVESRDAIQRAEYKDAIQRAEYKIVAD
jgi:hypothetical protein